MLCKWQLGQFMASWSPSSNQIWFGYFSPLKVILGAKVTNVTCDVMYFNVDDDGRLWHVYSASNVWMSANTLAIQVVARSGKKWSLDPPFQECLLYCSLWVVCTSNPSSPGPPRFRLTIHT